MPDRVSLDRLLMACVETPVFAWNADRGLSGAHFLSRVNAWHAQLTLTVGSRIALFHSDALEFLAAMYAAYLRDLVVVVAADTLGANMQRLVHEVQAFVGEFGERTQVSTPPEAALDLDLARALPQGLQHTLLLFTSGSSGAPLLVEKRLWQLEREIEALEAAFGAQCTSRVCATVSHQHIYGLLFRLLWPASAGRAFDVRSDAYLEPIAARALAHPLTLITSPAHLKRLPISLDWQPRQNQLSAVFSSGGPLSTEAALAATQVMGPCPIEVYGSTESGGIGWRQQRDLNTPFRPLPGVRIQLDPDGALQVQSAHLPADAWLSMADRAETSDGTHFRVCGRVDRIVKLEEKRVSLDAIENAARASEWLDGARVVFLDGARASLGLIAIPSARGQEHLLQHGRRALSLRLRDDLRRVCEPIAMPRRFRFVDALPIDSQGKTSELVLHALFGERESRPQMPFHQWLDRTPAHARLALLISPDMHHFQGHFPDQPILPGVVQLDWVIALAREAFELPKQFLRMETLKFQALIPPRTRLELSLDWNPARSALSFRLVSGANAADGQAAVAHASARVIFADAHV